MTENAAPPVGGQSAPRRKLIEVSLPLEAINAEAAREKSIRHGHPSTLHLWWARRPLAAARAVLFAQLVDDPSSDADSYRTEAERDGMAGEEADAYVEERVAAERERLHEMIRRLVKWENIGDESLYRQAHAEILRSTGGNPPPILDPFCGGGTIPLEAQRLGLEAHGSDLNPVAVLITKALIEIPPKFAGRPPIFPGAAGERLGDWPRATGLAEDVRRYGAWMGGEAEKRIGHLYPKATLPDGSPATVIAWIWARTVTCPNPACGIRMPLVRSWWLGKKKGKEAYVVPTVVDGEVRFDIGHDAARAPGTSGGIEDGTVGRTGATCLGCGTAVELKYIRAEGRAGRIGSQLMATVAEGNRRREYLAPTVEHAAAANVPLPSDVPAGELPKNPRDFKTPNYGMTTFASLFTNRQLTALTTFSDLVGEARERVLADARAAGMDDGGRLADGGTDAAAYADAVATYLGFGVSRLADIANMLCTWENTKTQVRHLFTRQAIPMIWDYAETLPFGNAAGGFEVSLGNLIKVINAAGPVPGEGNQYDASSRSYEHLLISTDPPYYDNIGYSDLSDFFYVWLRRSLRDVHPKLLSTMLVPKADELVANPYRHEGKDGAQQFFERGFRDVFAHARESASADYPITVFYAYKQAEATSADGTASTGWQTLLDGMIRGGWQITGTWPMRSELGNRMLASGTNALASSIVLSLRPRPESAAMVDRRAFTAELREVLPAKLHELQQGSIAAVDLPQAAIGPGMAVFSRYSRVVESDGSPMSVGSALGLINQVLGEVLWKQEGDFDPGTRWCLKWFEAHGFDAGPYGEAETLASAYRTTIAGLARSGTLTAGGGSVRLFAPGEMPADYDPRADADITLWEVVMHLAKQLDEGGLEASGRLFTRATGRIDLDAGKQLAYLLFDIAGHPSRNWSKIGGLFNVLSASWADVVDAASRTPADPGEQLTLDAGV